MPVGEKSSLPRPTAADGIVYDNNGRKKDFPPCRATPPLAGRLRKQHVEKWRLRADEKEKPPR
ncbi:MAG: hypothetical protein ABIJ46_01900 [bacterium]